MNANNPEAMNSQAQECFEFMAGKISSKSQAPNSRETSSSKLQAGISSAGIAACCLELLWSLGFGAWSFSSPPSQPYQTAQHQHAARHPRQQNPLRFLQLRAGHH